MRCRLLCVLFILFVVTAHAVEPQWTAIPKLRDSAVTGVDPVTGDIDSRLPSQGLVSSRTYQDSDRGTWAHEATHGVNSLVRNNYAAGTGQSNAFYVLWGRAAVIKEPRPVTLREAARYIPQILKGQTYKLYMEQQAQSWNNEPLYALDEWTAYTNGAIQNLSRAERGRTIGGGSHDLVFTAEAAMHSLAVVIAVRSRTHRDPGFQYDDTQLKRYVAWNWNRMMILFADARKYPQLKDPMPYYQKFAAAPECAAWRKWARGYFGTDFATNVMRLSSD